MGRRAGLTEDKLRALTDFETNPALDEEERLVIRYAVGMTVTPVEVSPELFNALKQRYSPAQLVELTATIAQENYRARFNHAFEVESDEVSEGAFCPIPERPQLHK